MRTLNTFTKSSLVVAAVATVSLFCSLTMLSPYTLQAQDGKKDEMALYPLKKGMKWTYLAKTPKGEEFKIYREVTDTNLFSKLLCYEVKDKLGGAKQPRNLVRFSYIAAKDDGLYEVGSKAQGFQFTYEPPICILKPASNKVQTWKFDSRAISFLNGKFQQEDRVSGTYHQFADTINHDGKDVVATRVTVERKTKFPAGSESVVTVNHWYLPGKGEIKTTLTANPNSSLYFLSRVLIDFSGNASSIKIGDIVINETPIEKEASSETVRGAGRHHYGVHKKANHHKESQLLHETRTRR